MLSDSLSSRLLEWITGFQATRKPLRRFFNEQQIEDALDVIVGKKKAGTLSCLMASSLLRFITLIGSSAFGTSSKLVEENLSLATNQTPEYLLFEKDCRGYTGICSKKK